MTTKRGRPKKIAGPSGTPPAKADQSSGSAILGSEWLQSAEKARKEIRSHFNASVSSKHAYAMASLGHESLAGCEHKILDDDAIRKQRLQRQQQKSASTVTGRGQAVLEKNKDLVAKHTRDPVKFTRNFLAKRIYDEWEPRGDGHKRPVQKTIDSWLKKLSANHSGAKK